MKKLFIPLLMAGLFASSSMAYAETRPYVSLSGGLGLKNNSTINGIYPAAPPFNIEIKDAVKYKAGYLYALAVGFQDYDYHLEAELGYRRNSVDKYLDQSVPDDSYLSMWSLMLNGYYDFIDDETTRPYILIGLGGVKATYDDAYTSDTSIQFAVQVGAGLGINISDNMIVDISYRYFAPADGDFDDFQLSLTSSNFLAGIRYLF